MVDGLLQVEGGRPLSGEITVRGAKNLVSKAMVAALLGATPSVLRNVPLIRDVDVVSGLLAAAWNWYREGAERPFTVYADAAMDVLAEKLAAM